MSSIHAGKMEVVCHRADRTAYNSWIMVSLLVFSRIKQLSIYTHPSSNSPSFAFCIHVIVIPHAISLVPEDLGHCVILFFSQILILPAVSVVANFFVEFTEDAGIHAQEAVEIHRHNVGHLQVLQCT